MYNINKEKEAIPGVSKTLIDARDLFGLLNNFTSRNIVTKQNEGKRNATGLNRWRVRYVNLQGSSKAWMDMEGLEVQSFPELNA